MIAFCVKRRIDKGTFARIMEKIKKIKNVSDPYCFPCFNYRRQAGILNFKQFPVIYFYRRIMFVLLKNIQCLK